MKKYTTLVIFLLAVIVLAAAVAPVLAQDPQQPSMDAVNHVARKLNCPTCQSLNLEDCRTQTCDQWRGQIKDLLAEGYSEQEVLDWFIARFGVEVLQEPPRQGHGLFAWLLPGAGMLIGIGWLAFILRRWSAAKPPEAVPVAETPEAPGVDEETLRKIEEDLKDF